MNDDLVKRLRANGLDECDEAIARIEELEALNREQALQFIASEGQAQEAYARQVEIEAKLGKAMVTLEYIAETLGLHSAKVTLAALKGWKE